MSMDWALREQGSRDWRMLPVALTMWAASLGSHSAFAWWSEREADALPSDGIGWERLLPGGMACLVLILVVLLAHHLRMRWPGVLAVCIAAACVGSMTTIAADTIAWHDSAMTQARQSSVQSAITATVTAPVVASDQRGYDCQADVRFSVIVIEGTDRGSVAKARVYADDPYCARMHRGAAYRLAGTLQQARYGRMPLWLLVDGSQPLAQVRDPPLHYALISRMQQAFFMVIEQLPDQGRVLVPGLTMGVLGQDYVGTDSQSMPIHATYANILEDRFRKSGIMHLMAVSGGHFVLLAGLVRRLGRWLLMDRRLTAVMIASMYVLLAAAMFPGDSVTRALIMGMMGAASHAMGRRSQALSALCWTVVGVLVVSPGMSTSYGFALSSAAVLGIVLFAGRLSRVLGHVLPHSLAEMMAMTIAAQLFTLPIQVLMEPELPLLSVPANLLVAPFVGLSTITGLMSLALAWCMPWLAGVFAWVSSWGTLVMERVAMWLGSNEIATLPWKDGVVGAALILLAELGIGALLVLVTRQVKRVRQPEAGLPGIRFGSVWRVRLTLWIEESRRLLSGDSS